MDHYGYVVMKFHVNDGKRIDSSNKTKHNHAIIEIIKAMDPSLKHIGSLNTSQSITEKEIDSLFNELCHMRGGRHLQKVTKYINKLNRTNPLQDGDKL